MQLSRLLPCVAGITLKYLWMLTGYILVTTCHVN